MRIPTCVIPPLKPKDIARFLSKVCKGKPDECWEWMAGKQNNGYGIFLLGSRLDGSRHSFYAHRVAWTIANGPIPPGMCICHTCDNPACCNPAHEFRGSHADNMADAAKKGRTARGDKHGRYTHPEQTARGEQHGQAKRTKREILAIRDEYAHGDISQHALGRKWNMSVGEIHNIVRRKNWTHI